MPETKILPPDVDYRLAESAADFVAPATLGRQPVWGEEQRTQDLLTADLIGQQLPIAQQLEAQELHQGHDSLTAEEQEWLYEHRVDELVDIQNGAKEFMDFAVSNRKEELQKVRDRLTDLSTEDKMALDNYLDLAAPAFFAQSKELSDKESGNSGVNSLSTWFATDATDEQLTNFLQWHVHMLVEQQKSPEVEAAIEQQRAAYKVMIQKGIDEGKFSSDAQAAIEKVDTVKVYIGDIFDTILLGRGGYYNGDNSVIINQGIGANAAARKADLIQVIPSILVHEWNHAVLGLFDSVWIDEALAEHTAVSILDGKFYGSIGAAIQENKDVYQDQRMLLDTVLMWGKDIIPPRLATKAFSSRIGSEEREAFLKAIDNSWGVQGALFKISRVVNAHTKLYQRSGKSLALAQALAAVYAMERLKYKPRAVFGPDYVSPVEQIREMVDA